MTIPAFPLDFTLTYLAEGGANIIYRIVPPPPSPGTLSTADSLAESYGPSTPPPTDLPPLMNDPLYTSKLLRLRKALPNLTSVLADQTAFANSIAPLLPSESVVKLTPVKLPAGLISACNAELRALESNGSRPAMRHGTYLADEEYASLVTDMSGSGDPHVVTLEFKPKWLAQAPSAPKNARRCRMCALTLKRRHAKTNKKGSSSDAPFPPDEGLFCPLRLLTLHADDYLAVAKIIVRDVTNSSATHQQSPYLPLRVAKWIAETPLLRKLRDLQVEFDPKGVLKAGAVEGTEVEKERLVVAMTLRDCSVFLKIPADKGAPIEARLGDLDVKSRAKVGSWTTVEKVLVEAGWYTDAFPGVEGLGPCVLEDQVARAAIA